MIVKNYINFKLDNGMTLNEITDDAYKSASRLSVSRSEDYFFRNTGVMDKSIVYYKSRYGTINDSNNLAKALTELKKFCIKFNKDYIDLLMSGISSNPVIKNCKFFTIDKLNINSNYNIAIWANHNMNFEFRDLFVKFLTDSITVEKITNIIAVNPYNFEITVQLVPPSPKVLILNDRYIYYYNFIDCTGCIDYKLIYNESDLISIFSSLVPDNKCSYDYNVSNNFEIDYDIETNAIDYINRLKLIFHEYRKIMCFDIIEI